MSFITKPLICTVKRKQYMDRTKILIKQHFGNYYYIYDTNPDKQFQVGLSLA